MVGKLALAMITLRSAWLWRERLVGSAAPAYVLPWKHLGCSANSEACQKKSTLARGGDSEWKIISTMGELLLSKAYVKPSLEAAENTDVSRSCNCPY